MSFTEAKLPKLLITDLYKNVLINSTKKVKLSVIEDEKKQPIRNSLEFLGENKKSIVIVVEDNEAVFIGDEKLQLLTNLLQACNLTIADVAIINIANKNLNYTSIKQNIAFENLLMMGINIKLFELPLVFSKNKVQQFNNANLLITENLDKLIGNSAEVKTEKRYLWNALKTMFNIQ